MSLKNIYSAHQGCIYLLKNTEENLLFCEISLQLKITIKITILLYFKI